MGEKRQIYHSDSLACQGRLREEGRYGGGRYFDFPCQLQSPRPGTEVLSGKSLEVLPPEVLPRVLWEIGVLQEVLPRVLREIGGALGSASEGLPPFLRILSPFSFSPLSTPPLPRQFSSPKSPLSATSNLLFLVEKRQAARAGLWGRFWTGSPHRKKRKIVVWTCFLSNRVSTLQGLQKTYHRGQTWKKGLFAIIILGGHSSCNSFKSTLRMATKGLKNIAN